MTPDGNIPTVEVADQTLFRRANSTADYHWLMRVRMRWGEGKCVWGRGGGLGRGAYAGEEGVGRGDAGGWEKWRKGGELEKELER